VLIINSTPRAESTGAFGYADRAMGSITGLCWQKAFGFRWKRAGGKETLIAGAKYKEEARWA
jgi:hypothetical protein